MSEIGIGIIGCGVRLRDVVRGILAKNNGLRVTVLCDPSPQSIEKAKQAIAPEAKVYQDYRDLVRDRDLAWVMAGSWNCSGVPAGH